MRAAVRGRAGLAGVAPAIGGRDPCFLESRGTGCHSRGSPLGFELDEIKR